MSVNHFHCIGRLVRDPELKDVRDENRVACFCLALKDREGSDRVSFLEVECWNRLADVVGDYLCKGRRVYVEGRLKQDRWESRGEKRSRVVVVARVIEFLDPPLSKEEGGGDLEVESFGIDLDDGVDYGLAR